VRRWTVPLELTRRDKTLLDFALSFLRTNLTDAEVEDALHARLGDDVPVEDYPYLAEKLQDRVAAATDETFGDRKIGRVLMGGDEMSADGTVGDLLDSAAYYLDGLGETEAVVFQVDGDPSWWVASVEVAIGEADPSFVSDLIEEGLDVIDAGVGTDDTAAEVQWMRDELARLNGGGEDDA
jgi:hypothetical protein